MYVNLQVLINRNEVISETQQVLQLVKGNQRILENDLSTKPLSVIYQPCDPEKVI